MPITITIETKEEKKKRKSAYNTAYIAENTTRVRVNLNHRTDADILAYLENVDNKQGLIKELLRARMAEEGFVYTPSEQENN